ncbi:Cytochrome c oxidase assembly protein COX11, mitochondrial [Orchesella cincta]|uniref:Cytochrome c oxidase assembly protein COX11, mitochondrial n=1 Tax=Orchesella cincta TaxID=48709 RepID=A0A1D2NHN0_ORCCI|nr:Cytochrome c oxidase assembly protein COX11, mitochondrial [Orchesella cincta]
MFGKLCCGGLRTVFRGNLNSGLVRELHDKASSVRKTSTLYYLGAVGVLVVGASYAAVPLYRIFCQSYSYGGTTGTHDNTRDLSQMKKVKEKQITIRFNADRSSSLMWNFRPEQAEIIVTPGETALAFYRAENKTGVAVDGISTYNVIPFDAGQYFNKIQCFCFEEQRLNPGETVELPVFFYIDPEFAEDPRMENVDLITLSYTFFASKEMSSLGGVISAMGKDSIVLVLVNKIDIVRL